MLTCIGSISVDFFLKEANSRGKEFLCELCFLFFTAFKHNKNALCLNDCYFYDYDENSILKITLSH